MPCLLSIMKTCPVGTLDFYFQQLSVLVFIVKQHIRNYLTELFDLIQEHWNPKSNIQITIITLIESVAVALAGEFNVYLPILLPQMLQVLETDTTEKRSPTQRLLHAMLTFGTSLEEYLHFVIPTIVKLFERQDAPPHLRKLAMQIISQLSCKINFMEQSSRIILALERVLATPHVELRMAAMDTLSALVYHLKGNYAIFIPTLQKVYIN